jgi:AI-2 transport protein TqsA
MIEPPPSGPGLSPAWNGVNTLRVAAYATVVLVGSWYLLGQLASVLRPLLLAAFLGYILLPYYRRLSKNLSPPVAITLIAGATTLMLLGIAGMVTSSVVDLTTQAPELKQKAIRLFSQVTEWIFSLPGINSVPHPDKTPQTMAAERITEGVLLVVNVAVVGLPEAFAAGLYLLFLLLESARLPDRVRSAYPKDRADQILHVFGRINSAIVGYLKAKVKSSLVLALPVGLLLAGFNVRFAFLWGVLTFACNFIPYIGTVVAYSLPVGFAFLQFDSWITATVLAAVMLAMHILSASVVEPMLIGRAVGLSPIVILSALAVWGVLWGLPGMFLAVPLTVVVKIVLENIEITKPVGRLLGGE